MNNSITNQTHATTSYHNSKAKRASRAFKLIHAKRAMRRYPANGRPGNIVTLCGNSVSFESALVAYGLEKGIECEVHSYNDKPAEVIGAYQRRAELPQAIASRISINAYTLKTHCLTEGTVFVDFDTCSWFPTVAQATIDMCEHTSVMALTINIKGVRDFHCKDGFDFLSESDCKDPETVAAYLQERTGMNCVGIFIYKNINAVFTMATIILERTSKPTKYRVGTCLMAKPKKQRARSIYRDQIRAMLVAGGTIEETAAKFGASLRTVGAIKAWLSPSFDKFRKND